jgi:hypothetical protein
MPGLLRGIARTAVAAGTFTAVSNRVSRHQANKWANQDQQQYQQAPPPPQQYPQTGQYVQTAQPQYYQQPAPAPVAPPPDPVAQLKELAELKNQGILTEDEFAAQKAKILG